MSTTNLTQFYSVLQSTGVVYSYQYRIEIDLPKNSQGDQGSGAQPIDPLYSLLATFAAKSTNKDLISFFAQSASLPSKTLTEVELSYQGFGFSFPNTLTFDRNFSMNVLCDAKFDLRDMFETWQKIHASLANGGGGVKIIPTDTNLNLFLLSSYLEYEKPSNKVSPIVGPSAAPSSEQEYYERDATSSVDQKGDWLKHYKLFSCWPKSVGQISLGNDNTSIASFDVQLVYQYYYDVDKNSTGNDFNDMPIRTG